MWLFGYGSLIWKMDYPCEEKINGIIKGFVRRFWQSSTDHRGTESFPGRVVTLIPWNEWKTYSDDIHSDGVVWGTAFKIPDEHWEEVKAKLDYREKGGYSSHYVDVYLSENDKTPVVKKALVYIGTNDNPHFVGPETISEIANIIAFAHGPSGPNVEYLFNLCKAQRNSSNVSWDTHLFSLEEKVLQVIEEKQLAIPNNVIGNLNGNRDMAEENETSSL